MAGAHAAKTQEPDTDKAPPRRAGRSLSGAAQKHSRRRTRRNALVAGGVVLVLIVFVMAVNGSSNKRPAPTTTTTVTAAPSALAETACLTLASSISTSTSALAELGQAAILPPPENNLTFQALPADWMAKQTQAQDAVTTLGSAYTQMQNTLVTTLPGAATLTARQDVSRGQARLASAQQKLDSVASTSDTGALGAVLTALPKLVGNVPTVFVDLEHGTMASAFLAAPDCTH